MKEQNIYSGFKVERIETVQEISGTAICFAMRSPAPVYYTLMRTTRIKCSPFLSAHHLRTAPGWPILWSIPYFAGHVNSL